MLMERLKTTRDLRENIFRALQEGPNALRPIASNLYSMAMLNYDFYQKTATSYAKAAQELSRPLEPPGGAS
jgi:tRNA nucleotidyltransferase/poly(A) polymerase